MKAVEFEATVEDGTIRVPERYRAGLGGFVRVILLAPDEGGGETTPSASC